MPKPTPNSFQRNIPNAADRRRAHRDAEREARHRHEKARALSIAGKYQRAILETRKAEKAAALAAVLKDSI